jgi:integrase
MDRHAATRRLRHLAAHAGVRLLRRLAAHAGVRLLRHLAAHAGVRLLRMHPHMLRHTFVTTMLDAGVDLRDVQIAARHADPRTTMRYDRARKNLDRHPNYILAAYMAVWDLTASVHERTAPTILWRAERRFCRQLDPARG